MVCTEDNCTYIAQTVHLPGRPKLGDPREHDYMRQQIRKELLLNVSYYNYYTILEVAIDIVHENADVRMGKIPPVDAF